MDDRRAAFDEKFRLRELALGHTEGWNLSLRPDQITLGSMVLSLAADKFDLSGLSEAEARGMAAGFGQAERLAREVFGAVRINILCLMMQDPIVHFHILPRYDHPLNRHGRDWVDADWPGPPAIRAAPIDTDMLHRLRDELRAALSAK